MEALTILEKNPDIQLAIVDFAMPQMSGIQTIRAIRKINPNIRIILSSGFADQERAVTPNSGIQAFLQKPVQLESLAETLEMVLKNPV
jgi:CheY-like chemotaxis protein